MAFERFARLQQLLYGLPFCGFNSDSIRFERCAQIRSGKRPMRRPLFTEINAYSDIVENAQTEIAYFFADADLCPRSR